MAEGNKNRIFGPGSEEKARETWRWAHERAAGGGVELRKLNPESAEDGDWVVEIPPAGSGTGSAMKRVIDQDLV